MVFSPLTVQIGIVAVAGGMQVHQSDVGAMRNVDLPTRLLELYARCREGAHELHDPDPQAPRAKGL